MLSIAYYNVAVEEEYCGNYLQSLPNFRKAYKYAEDLNGPKDPLVQKFKKQFEDAYEVSALQSLNLTNTL